ncbi:Ig-like domain-containing protein [Prevotella loescheii]|nr:Ig-like domain-containing protein [Hoylesella loescheii]
MKEKLLSFVKGSLHRMCLLIVMVLAGAGAYAQDAKGWKTLELNTLYNENNIFGVNDKYKFTPETDGTLVVWAQEAQLTVYTALNAEGTDVDENSRYSSFSYETATIQNVTFGKKETAQVKAGTTYYLTGGKGFSRDKKFIAVMETITELTFECDQPLGGMFDITDQRDGQAILTFNLPVTSNQWAYLKVGNYPQDPENGKVEVRSGNNTEQLILNIKEYLTAWKEEGRYNAGDPVTLTLTGVKSRGENPLVYGTDGTLVLKWTAPGDLHKNTGITAPDPFLSYWLPGDERGIMVLDFDYPLMTMENGQTATVSFTIGSADMGDAYQGQLPQDKISVDGQKLYIDFTGVRRTYADMGLTQKWESISIKVNYIKMADGTMCFSPSAGNYGSVSTECKFEEYKSDIQAEFTPADGATLTENSFKVYFSDKKALTFSGVRVTYQTQDDIKYQTDITEGITSTDEGKNGIEYTIPLTADIVAGKNVRISFLNQVSNDGFDHDFNVRYNPGPELINDLEPTSVSVADNAIIDSFDKLTLTFDEDVNIRTLEGGVLSLLITDLTTNAKVDAEITAEGKTVTVTPSSPLINTHKYDIYINHEVIVNNEYIKTNGKYGRYMKGKDINFTFFKDYATYDFMTDPIAGSTVRELSVIKCTQKEGTDSYYNAISITRQEDKEVYVIDSNRKRVTTCKIEDNIVSGFTLTLENPITTSGEYTVVIEDSVYVTGEGFGQEKNASPVYLKYTVLAAPQAVITVESSDPASESTVESLSQVMIEFSEEVYGKDETVYFFDPVNYVQYPATFQVNPKNRKVAMVSLAEPITEAGNYRLTLEEGVVGDQAWNDSGYMTGKVNVGTTLFFTVGSGSQGGDNSQWKTDPENGSTVTSLKTIHVWNTTVSEMGCGSGKITVKRDGVELEKIADTNFGVDLNELIISTSVEYTENGTYTFEAPEGFFVDGSGNALPAVTFTYTIGNGGGAVTSDWKTDPADGSTVTSLKTIHVWNTTVSAMAGGSGKITVKRDGVELEKISDANYGEDLNELIISTSVEYTEDGTYTFEAPEGFFVDDSGNALPAVTFTYYIGEAAGIDNINADTDGKVNVYSLDGKTVKMNATNDELKSLHGIYIINGKKVIRRK